MARFACWIFTFLFCATTWAGTLLGGSKIFFRNLAKAELGGKDKAFCGRLLLLGIAPQVEEGNLEFIRGLGDLFLNLRGISSLQSHLDDILGLEGAYLDPLSLSPEVEKRDKLSHRDTRALSGINILMLIELAQDEDNNGFATVDAIGAQSFLSSFLQAKQYGASSAAARLLETKIKSSMPNWRPMHPEDEKALSWKKDPQAVFNAEGIESVLREEGPYYLRHMYNHLNIYLKGLPNGQWKSDRAFFKFPTSVKMEIISLLSADANLRSEVILRHLRYLQLAMAPSTRDEFRNYLFDYFSSMAENAELLSEGDPEFLSIVPTDEERKWVLEFLDGLSDLFYELRGEQSLASKER